MRPLEAHTEIHQPALCPEARRLSELSPPGQALIRLCQEVGFGYLLDLHVREGEPVFDPPPRVVRDIKLLEEGEAPRTEMVDFQLRILRETDQ